MLAIGTREEAYLVERWLKCGNTVRKRETVRTVLETQSEQIARDLIYGAAAIWQQKLIRANTLTE